MLQEHALEKLKKGKNVFLTGQPGTGKTYTINKFINWCLDNGRFPTVTASTGIAAVHVGGSTLHSFAGVRDDNELTTQEIEDILSNQWVRERLTRCEILIIDEISMVSAKLLDVVDILTRHARQNTTSFGGIQIIVVGDFFQLPPVKGDFAFNAQVWEEASFECCYLHEQFRQSDKVFNDILTNIRAGHLDDEQKQIIRDRVVEDVSELGNVIRLDTHNRKVDTINQAKLERLEGKAKTYFMDERGNEKIVAMLKKNCLSPERLTLKVGAPVLFTRNDKDQRWVNGTQGTVKELNEHTVMVELLDGDVVEVEEMSWEKCEGYGSNKNVVAMISQIPLKLAWAITIHKSQGMTLDRAVIDVSHAFECGQAYVAVSRVRSLDGLYFQGRLTKNFLAVNEEVIEKDKEFISKGL